MLGSLLALQIATLPPEAVELRKQDPMLFDALQSLTAGTVWGYCMARTEGYTVEKSVEKGLEIGKFFFKANYERDESDIDEFLDSVIYDQKFKVIVTRGILQTCPEQF